MTRTRALAATLAVAATAVPATAVADGMHDDTTPAPAGMSVRLTVTPDAMKGYNLHIRARGFRWAPEHANQAARPREGHAHLYVDGKKVGRLYGPWFWLDALPAGRHVIKVTLNDNRHRGYVRGGTAVGAQRTVVAPAPAPAM